MKTGSGWAVVSVVASAFVVVGTCGSSGGGCGGGGGGGSSSSSTAGGSSSGGSSTGASGSSSGASNEPYTGSVILSDETFGPSTIHSSIVDILATPPTSSPYCSGGTVSGSCCYEPPPTGSSGSIPTAYSAGTVTIADGSATIGTDAFSGGAYAVLSSATTTSFTWNPGDSLMVSAPGATIDTFSATVKAPSLIAGLTPSFTSPTITLASDWTVTWTPDSQSGETMYVAVTPQGSPSKGEVSCSVADSAGTVTVPSALFANFTGATTASVIVIRGGGVNATDSNATVHVLAQVEVGGTATLQ